MSVHRSSELLHRQCGHLKLNKVLFIAYDFPPCRNVGGSLRSECFVRYLADFGWYPTIVSLGPAPATEQYPAVHRVRSLTPWHRPYELTPYGWSIPLFARVRRLLKEDSYDLIYVSCPPFPQTKVARRLAKAYGIPFILDLRDAWSLDPYVEGSRLKKIVYRHIYPTLEKRIFNDADTVLFNTPSALAEYQHLYPRLADRFVLLPNGYDEADFADARFTASPPECPLTIVHLGRFGIGNRDPRLIFDALKILKDDGIKIIFKIIGDSTGNLDLNAAAEGLSDMVEVAPTIPHSDALSELAKSDVAMLYQEVSTSKVTAVAGKTYEYIRSGKPIIAIAPIGDNLELIRKMAGFYRIIHQPTDAETLAAELRRLVILKTRNELPIVSAPREEYIKKFSRRAITASLVEQFEIALQRVHTHPS